MSNRLFALGWDVGGWMGKNNSFVIIEVDRQSKELNWYYTESNHQISKGDLFELTDIFAELTNEKFNKQSEIVLGIDAPLTFPKQFVEFLSDKNDYIKKPELEIFNPLAYRETDRFIYRQYGKKPLSATFDRLGNNTTVVISHLRYWNKKYDFEIETNNLEYNKDKINVIETYPALLKPGKYEKAFPPIEKNIPDQIKAGTDQYDAALCALMALQFGFNNNFEGLPSLVFPAENRTIYKEEGWIYHFDLENIKK